MAWPHCPVPGCGKATGVSEAAGAGLKKCKRCLRVMYCSKSCQVAAWKGGHKHECKPPQQARAGTGAAAGDDASLAAAVGAARPAPKDYASSPVTSSLPPWLAGLSIGPDEVAASIRTLYDMGLHRDVLQREEEGLAAAEELRSKNPENAVMIYSMLGVSFDMCCEPDKGLGLLEQAKALATEGGDREALGESCIRLGVHHMGQGDAEKAIVVLQQAKSIAMEIGQRLGEAETNLFLGISFMYLKQFDRAIDLLEQSVAVHKELRRPRGLAHARVNLGRCLSVHGQHDRAIACLKQAWFGYEELGNPDELPRAAVRRGEVLWEHARAEHLQAAPDATSFGGVSAAVAGRLKRAETWLLRGLELAGEVRIINLKMDAVIHLACVAMLKGDEDEAINHLAQFLHWWLELAPKTCSACGRERRESTQLMTCDGCRVARCVLCQALAVRQRLP